MNQLKRTVFATNASLQTASLIVGHVIGGVGFAVFVLSWQPRFHVNAARIGLANIGGAFLNNLIRNTQRFKQILLNRHHQKVLVKTILGCRKAFHFKLIKLVHTKDALHIFAVSAGFAAKTGGVPKVAHRQLRFAKDFICVHTTKNVLGASLQPQVVTLKFVAIIARLKPVHGVVKFGANHERRQNGRKRLRRNLAFKTSLFRNFRQRLLACECVNHKLNHRELQLYHVALNVGKATPRHFRGTLFVYPVARFGNLPMVFRGKRKLRWLAHFFRNDIIVLGRAQRNIGQCHIWHLLLKRQRFGFKRL